MASQERRKDREETVWPGKEGVPHDGCIFDYETEEKMTQSEDGSWRYDKVQSVARAKG